MSTIYYNANLFDGNKTETTKNAWFEVENGKITSIGTGKPTSMAENQIDLHNKFVTPGLINAHTHMMMNPVTNKLEYLSETEVTATALQNLRDMLESGVTYIRDCGCAFNTDIKLRDFAKDHHIKAPGIIASGRPMSMTGGHGDFKEGLNGDIDWSYLTDSPNEMRKSVRTALKLGADNIKVMATGGVMSAGDNIDDTALTPAEMRVAVEEAHHKRKTVAAHAQGNSGIQNALDAGVDSIEHGIYVDEKQAAFMAKNNVYLVPTLNAAASISKYGRDKLPSYMIRKNDQVKYDFFKNVSMAFKNGVKVIVGTDAGTPFNSFKTGTWEEMQLLVNEIGATPAQALLSATKYAADLLGISKNYGTLEAGKYADFLVLDHDPTQKIDAITQSDKSVFQHGKQIK
ncbi:imidazolonepropionase [Lentilactobacillus sunkii]|jgi:imidazolonepropionase-like amidohydrolase|uniref:Imidazolonepropionase n=1 Tax=Lentilactobacillus sunkii TaxID=481719 RepID=A0A1E7XJ48_9LACO|nr:amidohydrolase family protein [Lentilactobacillus sunkii]OFA13126.1 imidazolonepropionase [Lentilactobacillus sunkii]